MSGVTRYSGMGSTWTMPSENGDYVKYDDYAALEARCAALAAELEAAEKCITELEARTVTLPDVEKWRSVDAVRAQSAYKVLVSKVLAADGIGVKGE